MASEPDIVGQIERLLEAERSAIVTLDGEAVEALSVTKERLFGELREAPLGQLDKQRLRAIAEGSRRNLLLLAHARDLTKKAIEAVTQAERRAVRLSVTG